MRILLAMLWATLLPAEVLDRIAVSVDQVVITESELVQEVKLTSFWNRQAPNRTPEALREAAKRMIERALIRRELQLTPVPPPSHEEVQKLLDEFREAEFPNRLQYGEALDRYGLTEDQLKDHLREQYLTLRFINDRFRPEVEVSEEEIQEYYNEEFPKTYGSRPIPPLNEIQGQIERVLVEKKIDRKLDRWIDDSLKLSRIRVREEVFQ